MNQPSNQQGHVQNPVAPFPPTPMASDEPTVPNEVHPLAQQTSPAVELAPSRSLKNPHTLLSRIHPFGCGSTLFIDETLFIQ